MSLRQPDYDHDIWGPPMPFREAIELSKDDVAGLFDELPDDYPDDAPGTVMNVRLNKLGEPYVINDRHYLSSEVDRLVAERNDWHAFQPTDAVTQLGKLHSGEPYTLPPPHVDWTRPDNRISVGFKVYGGKPDEQFIVRLDILDDPGWGMNDVVTQLGDVSADDVPGPRTRVKRVIGPDLPGSGLERGIICGVRAGERYIAKLIPDGLGIGDVTLLPSLLPSVYRTEEP